MAALVISAAGAALGGALLGPGAVVFGLSGAQLGWLGGSLLASAFTPGQKSEGPRLGDLSVSSSAYGAPIPYLLGHSRFAGQIVWASAKREIASTQSQGKGGGGSQYTSYTYEVDLLILLTDNVIAGIPRIWLDGALVYSSDTASGESSLANSLHVPQWQRLTVYTGSASQLPDPTYEAAVGTANAPAYRGRGSVFIQGLQLGGGGNLPNITPEVAESGAVVAGAVQLASNGSVSLSNGTRSWFYAPASSSSGGVYIRRATPRTGRWYIEHALDTGTSGRGWYLGVINHSLWTGASYPQTAYGGNVWCVTNMNLFGVIPGTVLDGVSTNDARFDSAWGAGSILGMAVDFDLGKAWIHLNGVWFGSDPTSEGGETFKFPIGGALDPWFMGYGQSPTVFIATAALKSGQSIHRPAGFAEFSIDTFTQSDKTLSASVSALCLRAGLSAGQFDVTALAAITRPVRGLVISQTSAVRAVIELLMQTYFFEAVLSDKIYFRPRAAASVLTIPFAELGSASGGNSGPDPLALRQANELEIPAQMALTYQNFTADYQADTQYSDRLLTGQESTATTSLPMVLIGSEAKLVVDALLLDKAVAALSTSLSLQMHRAALEPTDVVTVLAEDGSSFRMRLTKRTEADGVFTFDAVLDDASVFTQLGLTSAGIAVTGVISGVARSSFEILDIPLLRDEDDRPGHYLAVTAKTANWQSAAVYSSADSLTYNLETTVSDAAIVGTCTTVLGAWTGGTVFDETNTVTVDVGTSGQLVSVTRDEIVNSQSVNAAVIGTLPPSTGSGALSGLGGLENCELIQYTTATLISTGVYKLSGLLRGRKGTEWHSGDRTSAANAAAGYYIFVALSNAGLRFMPLLASDLGRNRWYKVASAQQTLSQAVLRQDTLIGNNQLCLSVTDVRANRNAADTVVTWKRRTRYTTRIGGALTQLIPLGETTERYKVYAFFEFACTNIIPRTLTLYVDTPSWTYTNADQVTDFGSAQGTLHVKIFQVSAQVGIGDAAVFQGHPAWHV